MKPSGVWKFVALMLTLVLFASQGLTSCPVTPTTVGSYLAGLRVTGNPLTFNGTLSHDNDGIYSGYTPRWRWDFDYQGTFTEDLNTTSGYPSWTYSVPGTYTVAVIYYDNDNQQGNLYTFQVTISQTQLKRYYYVKDHLGSVRLTLKEDGTIAGYDDYDAWGLTLDGRSGVSGNDPRIKFTGKERDLETGYDYFGARYYDARIGRWLSVDPLVDKFPGVSSFNYSLNNPIANIDPDGKFVLRSINGHSVFTRLGTGDALAVHAGGLIPFGYGLPALVFQTGLSDPSVGIPSFLDYGWSVIGKHLVGEFQAALIDKISAGVSAFDVIKATIIDEAIFKELLEKRSDGIPWVIAKSINPNSGEIVESATDIIGRGKLAIMPNPEFIKKYFHGDEAEASSRLDEYIRRQWQIRNRELYNKLYESKEGPRDIKDGATRDAANRKYPQFRVDENGI
ncbi:MAG: RHS repeat-associated core domain-containing protein [Bacteroidota bacterium]